MDRAIAMLKRRQLTRWFSFCGLMIAAVFAVYGGINPSVETHAELWVGTASVVLCPGSFLFATFIDADPWTNGFYFMWLVIGLINLALYGAVGAAIGRFL